RGYELSNAQEDSALSILRDELKRRNQDTSLASLRKDLKHAKAQRCGSGAKLSAIKNYVYVAGTKDEAYNPKNGATMLPAAFNKVYHSIVPHGFDMSPLDYAIKVCGMP